MKKYGVYLILYKHDTGKEIKFLAGEFSDLYFAELFAKYCLSLKRCDEYSIIEC